MTRQLPLTFSEVTPADIPLLTRLMTKAFDVDYQRYGAPGSDRPYHYEQADFFRKWPFGCIDAANYKISYNNTLIGAVIVWMFAHDQNVLGLLFVDPAYQNYGVGVKAWQFIESRYPDIRTWTVATPEWSLKDHYFYEQRCGFRQINTDGDHWVYQKDIIPFGAEG